MKLFICSYDSCAKIAIDRCAVSSVKAIRFQMPFHHPSLHILHPEGKATIISMEYGKDRQAGEI